MSGPHLEEDGTGRRPVDAGYRHHQVDLILVFGQPVVDDLLVALEPWHRRRRRADRAEKEAAVVEFGGQDIAQLVDVATHMAGQ